MYKEIYKNENPSFTICYNKNDIPAARWSVAWDGRRDSASSLYSVIRLAYNHGLIEEADISRLQALLSH